MSLTDDDVALAKRVFRDLNNAFDRESGLVEFEIIMQNEQIVNTSPVTSIDLRLGLENWTVPYLFKYCYNEFMKFQANPLSSDALTMSQLTRTLLLLNPDLKTAWNCRKQLVVDRCLNVADELKLSAIICKRRQKCSENFFHRQWLVQYHQAVVGFPDATFVNVELDLCYEASRRYPTNYYAWDHRRWVVNTYCHDLPRLENEMVSTKIWIARHISDYSGFSFRQFVMVRLGRLFSSFRERRIAQADRRKMYLDDMDWVDDLLRLHCNRESLFLHRRFVITQIISFDSLAETHLYNREKKFILEYVRLGRDKILIHRHLRFLKHKLTWEFL